MFELYEEGIFRPYAILFYRCFTEMNIAILISDPFLEPELLLQVILVTIKAYPAYF